MTAKKADLPSPVHVRIEELKQARAAGESWGSISQRLGVSQPSLAVIFKKGEDHTVARRPYAPRPSKARALTDAKAQAKRDYQREYREREKKAKRGYVKKPAAALIPTSQLNKALAVDVPHRPELAGCRDLINVMVKIGIRRITIDLDRDCIEVVNTERYPIGVATTNGVNGHT